MRIFLAIPTMNPRLLDKCLFNAWSHTKVPIGTLVWFNGMQYRDAHQATLDMGSLRTSLKFPGMLRTDFSTENLGVPRALTKLTHMAKSFSPGEKDFVLFIHDDVILFEEDWAQKCLDWAAERPNCGSFGFGGAAGIGDPQIYKIPYQLQQLARRGFCSNMLGGEAHGMIETSPKQVAVLDGFSMAVRWDLLTQLDGWSWWPDRLPHHCYDTSLGCMVKRHGLETWMFPIHCQHLGGQTATKVNYQQDFGQEESDIHRLGHEWMYAEFKDQLPIQI